MKLIVAQSSVASLDALSGYGTALFDILASEGHETQRLDLPSIALPGRALTNAASYRLLGTESADALICLDPVAAVLRHPRKLVWLLADTHLNADQAQLPGERAFDCTYLANVLLASLGEARAIFSPSRFALERLRGHSFDEAILLQPDVPGSAAHFPRNPGPELLVLNPLDDWQRPELLIACLAVLPEPFRARWVASVAHPETLYRLRRLAEEAGVAQRLAIDVRTIDAGEKAYLLAHAAALLELAPDALAIADPIHDAVRNGVPVIACKDGGALTEIARPSPQPVKPAGPALAEAVLAACAPLDRKSPVPAKSAKTSATGWAPLLKTLSK